MYSIVDMSLIVAVRDDQDVVMACDGRVLASDESVIADDSLKTLALNQDLCLGLAGRSDSMSQILGSLGLKCRGAHPVDIMRACQEVGCPIDVGYRDVRNELSDVLRWMVRRTPRHARSVLIPAVVLGGSSRGRPALCEWSRPTGTVTQAPPWGYSETVVGSMPNKGSRELLEFELIVRGERTTHVAERRLTRAVRFCSHYFGTTGPVNEIVFLRRLSQGFELMQAE